MKALLAKLDQTPGVTLVPCDRETALKAGELSSAYGLGTVDAVVAATAMLTKSHALLSRDSDFKQLRKRKVLKFESW